MATLVYTLSNKSNVVPGKKEVLVRFFHGKFNQRGKTRVFVDESQWDSDRQCNRIPKIRVMSDEKKAMIHELEQQNTTLNNLSAFLKKSFVYLYHLKIDFFLSLYFSNSSLLYPSLWLSNHLDIVLL